MFDYVMLATRSYRIKNQPSIRAFCRATPRLFGFQLFTLLLF